MHTPSTIPTSMPLPMPMSMPVSMPVSMPLSMPIVMLFTIVAAGCSPGRPTEATVPDQSACQVRANPAPGPVGDASGPYYHQVVVGGSNDGVTVANAKQVLDHASVPDGVRMNDGRVFIYYVNGARGGVWIAQAMNDSAHVLGPLVVDGISEPAGIVDPDAVNIGNKIRLYYLSGFGPPGSGVGRAICMAESIDGVNFQTSGVALSLTANELLTDPSVVQANDGKWHMAISLGQRTVLATSSDGIRFTRTDTLDYGGVPELARTSSGALRLYVCAQGIVSYTSTNGGITWLREATVVAPPTGAKKIVCDPSSVAGAALFIYKTG